MADRINSRLLFENNDADTGESYMTLEVKWGRVRPAFVDMMTPALVGTVLQKTGEIQKVAEAARAAAEPPA